MAKILGLKEIDYSSYHLLYLRHGKANSAFQAGSDKDRVLTDQGKTRARSTAKVIREIKLTPDLIICSGATRTRQTLEEALKVFGDIPEVEYKMSLYQQIDLEIIDIINHVQDAKTLLLIGHEPTSSLISHYFANKKSDSELTDYISSGMSTAQCSILESKEPFQKWEENSAELIGIIRGSEN